MLLAIVAMLLGASAASALVVHLPGGRTLSYVPLRGGASVKPFDQLFTNLEYGGGRVMPSNTNYTVYWAPPRSPAYPVEYQAGVDRYLSDLAHDSGTAQNVDSVATQYNDRLGNFADYSSSFGGALVDTDPYPTNGCAQAAICLSDEQIRNELKAFVAAKKLPMDGHHEYFMLTPPKVEDCFVEEGSEKCSAGSKEPFYCAYHSSTSVAEAQLIYATDPYVTGNGGCDDGNHPNGTTSDGAIQGGLSHEHVESLTDPVPNFGWVDLVTGGTTGSEIGDKCRNVGAAEEFGTPLGEVAVGGKKAKYNQLVNGHPYWYQQEWSDQGHRCKQRLTFAGAEPSATFTSTPAAGTELTFNAAGSSAPGGVHRYSWQYNDGSNPLETSEASVSHKFPSAGNYLVALTVYAQDGTAIGNARLVKTGDEGPVSSFSVAGAGSPPGAIVSFDGSASSDPDGSITSYEWAFGDGSRATGASASHSYASAGTYVATLIATDSSGQKASISHEVEVGEDESPSVSFSLGSSSPAAGAPASFTASAGDPDGAITAYAWGFGDGAVGAGSVSSHTYAAPGAYSVTLTVTDSSARTASETRSVTVAPAAEAGPAANASGSPPAGGASAAANPSSALALGTLTAELAGSPLLPAARASINAGTGAVTLRQTLGEGGTLSWLLTFPNGRFGVYAASRCGPALVRLRGRCRPARVVFARGSRTVASPGPATVILKPSAAGLRALRRAARAGKALPVTATLRFRPGRGGALVVRTQLLSLRLRGH